jgi:hypothetical protein
MWSLNIGSKFYQIVKRAVLLLIYLFHFMWGWGSIVYSYMYRWEVLVLELVCAVTVNGVDGTFAQPWEHHPCPVGSSNHLFLKYKGVGVVCVFGMVSSLDKI